MILRRFRTGHPHPNATTNLGSVQGKLGEIRRAIEYWEAALAIAQDIGDRRLEGTVLGNLGTAYQMLGRPDRTRALWTEALAILESIEAPNADKFRRRLAELDG